MSEVSAVELKKVANTFPSKTSLSFDGFSMKIIKLIFPHIATVLLAIINKSFMSRAFPNMLKVAHVFQCSKEEPMINLLIIDPYQYYLAYQKFSNV